LVNVKNWLAISQLKEVRRKRAQFPEVFVAWCQKIGLEHFGFRFA
jgi:hypothetical protein